MKILVMGAGAVGGYFGARLEEAGEEVVFCARGENLRAMREHGLSVESFRGDLRLEKVNATADPRAFAPYDLILFCVKAYDTDTAAELIDRCLAPGGAILTLQNGVESESGLTERFGIASLMGGNARVGAELAAPGKIVHHTTGAIEFGELDGSNSARALKIADAFRRAGIFGQLVSDIRSLRWYKLLWNSAFNPVTTLTRRRVGDLLDDPDGLALVRTLMEETLAAAQADGAALRQEHIDRAARAFASQPARAENFDPSGLRARQAAGVRSAERRRDQSRAAPRRRGSGNRDRVCVAEAARCGERVET